MQTIKAIALVGFYHGEPLIHPGQIIDLSPKAFNELRGMQKVDYAPASVLVEVPKETKAAKKDKTAE
jgi:hypothetical protein